MANKRMFGIRGVRPSQVAAALLPPDMAWCTTCHMRVPRKHLAVHNASRLHVLARSKLDKLKQLSLHMWQQHRGAPLDAESAHSDDIAREFARFRADQQRRDEEAVAHAWQHRGMRGGGREW